MKVYEVELNQLKNWESSKCRALNRSFSLLSKYQKKKKRVSMQGQQGSTPHTTIIIPIRTVCEVPPLYMINANLHFKRSMGNGFLLLCHLPNCFLLYLPFYILPLPHIFYEANANKSLF